jgi:hypothetical protein
VRFSKILQKPRLPKGYSTMQVYTSWPQMLTHFLVSEKRATDAACSKAVPPTQ